MACIHLPKPNKKLQSIAASADECRDLNCSASPYDLWICTHNGCGFVGCGRGSKSHAEMHAERSGHSVALQSRDGRIWCYACDSEVKEDLRAPADYNQRIKAFRGMALGQNGVIAAAATGNVATNASPTMAAGGIPTGPLSPTDFINARAPDAESARALTSAHKLRYPPNSGLTGLSNLGNTCFLAAGLQALSNIAPFSVYFSEVPFSAAPDRVEAEPKMPMVMRGLVTSLWDVHPSATTQQGEAVPPYRPVSVLHALRKLSPLFEGFHQQDAHEALRTILGELHERLAVDYPVGLYSNDHGMGSGGSGVGAGAESDTGEGSSSSKRARGHASGPGATSPQPQHAAVSLRDLRQAEKQQQGRSTRGGDSRSGRAGRGSKGGKDADSDSDEDEDQQESSSDRRARAKKAGVAASSGGAAAGAGALPGREWLHEGPYTGPDVIGRSIVSDLFGGVFASRVRCRACGTHSITHEPFQDLSLPIPKGRHRISNGGDGSSIPGEAWAWMKEGEAEAVQAELLANSDGSGTGGSDGSPRGQHTGQGDDAMDESPVGGAGASAGSVGQNSQPRGLPRVGSKAGAGQLPDMAGTVVVPNTMRTALSQAGDMDVDGHEAGANGPAAGQGTPTPGQDGEGGGTGHGKGEAGGQGDSVPLHGGANGANGSSHAREAAHGSISNKLLSLFCLFGMGSGAGAGTDPAPSRQASTVGANSGGSGPGAPPPSSASSSAPTGASSWLGPLIDSSIGNGLGLGGLGLGDVLYHFFGWEALEAGDQYFCEVCNKKVNADRKISVAALPEVLVLQLKRFSYHGWGSKNSASVAFPLTGLDLTPFVWDGAHTQAVRSFTRAKEQQVGMKLGLGLVGSGAGTGAAAGRSDRSGLAVGKGGAGATAAAARPASGSNAGPSTSAATPSAPSPSRFVSKTGTRVLLEMSPDTRALFLHRHSLAQGHTGVEAVVAEASALQLALQAAGEGKGKAGVAGSSAGSGTGTLVAGTAAGAIELDLSQPLQLRFPASFALAYASQLPSKLAAPYVLAPVHVPRPPPGGPLLPPALSQAVPVPRHRRESPTTFGGAKYDLTSLVQHSGVFNGGHYVAHAKHRMSGKWYTYDDGVVSQTDGDSVARKEGYLLFYTRQKPPSGSPLAQVPLPKPGPNEPQTLYVSRSWWMRYRYLTVPGPITNADILCDHGYLKNDLPEAVKHVVGMTARQYEALATGYGACEPPLRTLDQCSTCVAEAAALKKRRQRERERITKVDSVELPQGEGQAWYLVSEYWLARWRAFINDQPGKNSGQGVGEAPHTDGTGRGVLPPGPIDNARLLGKDGRPLKNLRASMHYRGVNELVWQFLIGIYGGGPVLRRAAIEIYGPEV